MDKPLSFDEFHSKLDDTVLGLTAFVDGDGMKNHFGHILFWSERMAMKWLKASNPAQTMPDFTELTYGELSHWNKEQNFSYLLDAKALRIFQECQTQDLRVHSYGIKEKKLGGTLLAPFYNPFSDDFEILEAQLNAVKLGFASINEDLSLVTDADGDVVLFATKEEAAHYPLAPRTPLLMTHLMVRNHEAEGFRITGDATIMARIENLRGWQEYCDEEEVICRTLAKPGNR